MFAAEFEYATFELSNGRVQRPDGLFPATFALDTCCTSAFLFLHSSHGLALLQAKTHNIYHSQLTHTYLFCKPFVFLSLGSVHHLVVRIGDIVCFLWLFNTEIERLADRTILSSSSSNYLCTQCSYLILFKFSSCLPSEA